MISKLIQEQRALEKANLERRSELTFKILAYRKGGMSVKKLSEIYGCDVVNAVLADNGESPAISLVVTDAMIDGREQLSACSARLVKKMHRNRVGARA